MVDTQTLDRAHSLSGRVFAGSGAAITLAPNAHRLNLRCAAEALDQLSDTLGLNLPRAINASSAKGSRVALCLGSDEWLIFDAEADPIKDLRDVDVLHSAVDISHRNTAVLVSGPMAADLINAGCPRDVSAAAFPVGSVARTVFGKAEVVLYHAKPNVYRIEVWRSFSDYLFTYLEEAAASLVR